jgi:hypothetical protein
MPFTRQLERRYNIRHHIIDREALIADIHIRLAVSINAVCVTLSSTAAYDAPENTLKKILPNI